MARLCERPGCSSPAEVSYGFDAEQLSVWLDAFGGPLAARAGVLCLRHANAMVVPLGWMLDDRREPVPRLFRSPATSANADADAPRRRHAPRAGRRPQDDTEQLLLDAVLVASIPEDPDDAPAAEAAADTQAHDGGSPGADLVLESAVDADATDEPTPVVDIDGTQPWQPLFDPADDLSGLLQARGRLLSRAFRGVPRDE